MDGNYIDKYADDSYLIIGSNKDLTIGEEFDNIMKWADNNNMRLNQNKSKEIIFYSNKKVKEEIKSLHNFDNVERVTEITILGVTISGNFSVAKHVSDLCCHASKHFYALNILKNYGLKIDSLNQIF